MEKHKLYIADARNASSLIGESSVDLVITDPPYWNEVVYSKDENQLSRIEDYKFFLLQIKKVWEECGKVLKPGGVLAFWVHDLYRFQNEEAEYIPLHADLIGVLPLNIRICQISVWDRYLSRVRNYFPKNEGTKYQYVVICKKIGRHAYNQDLISQGLLREFWQPVWHFKTTPKIFGSRALFKIIFKIISPISDKLGFLKNKAGAVLKDEYKFENYKTTCPPEIAERLIKRFSKPGDIVLDPFLGSGTTMEAADKLGRRCIGIEINSEAIPVIQEKVGADKVEIISA